MVVFGLPWLDNLTSPYNIVEIEGDWLNHVFELGDLVRRRELLGPTHLIVYSSNEYIDMDELYMGLEPFIHDLEGVSINRAASVESIAYDLFLLSRVKNGAAFVILPYYKDMPSHIFSTKIPLLRHAIEASSRNGWSIVIANPILTPKNRVPQVWITSNILRLLFDEAGNVVIEKVRVPVVKVAVARQYFFQ